MSDNSVEPSSRNETLAQKLDELLRPLERSDAPGLVIAVAREGRVLYRRGVGMANVRHGVANMPTTRMRIASTSKQFTSLALLLLAEDGRLGFDDPVDHYLPGLSTGRGRPTLRHLMTHTAGLRCSLDMGGVANGTAAQPRDWQRRAMLRQRDTHFAPGHGQLYCNGSYHLLSSVVDAVAGMPFEQYLKERVLEPLGMQDSASVPDETFMEAGSAALHVAAAGGGWSSAPVDAEIRGDGGMVSTVDDLLRWLAAVRGVGRRIGTTATWEQLLKPTVLATGLESTYAMGVKRTSYRGTGVIHHSGGLYGLNSQAITVPAFAVDIVIIVNGAPVSATTLGWAVIDAVLQGQLAEPPPVFARAADFAQLVGATYQDPDGFVIRFDRVGEQLGIGLSGLGAAPAIRDEGEGVRVAFEDVGLGPIAWSKAELSQAAARLSSTVSGSPVEWRRLDASSGVTTLPRSQRFLSDELAAEAAIDRDNGILTLRGDYSAARRFRLEPLGEGVFLAEGIDGAEERFIVRLDSDGCFRLDTYRARGMRLEPV